MKCEDFLKQWQCGDTLTDDMNKHLLECKHCATKLKNYNDMLGYIKTNNYPTKVNVVSDVMQTIENSQNIEKPKPKKTTFKQIATISLSMAAALALVLLLKNQAVYADNIEQQNEAIAGMFDDVYGYDNNNQHLSYNELDAIEYFLENYEE